MELITIILLALAGYVVHVWRDYTRFKEEMPFDVYFRLVRGDLFVTMVMTAAALAVLYDVDQLTGAAAFSAGYAGESLLRFLNAMGKDGDKES